MDKSLEELLSELDDLKKTTVKPKQTRRRIPLAWLVMIVVAIIAGGAYAATILLQHHTNTVTSTGPSLSSACSDPAALTTEGTIVTGASGYIFFDCGGATMAIGVTSTGGGSYTLAVTGMAAPYSSLWVVSGTVVSGQTSCETAYPIHLGGIASGSASITLASSTSYNYCVDYTNGGNAPALSFTWSQ